MTFITYVSTWYRVVNARPSPINPAPTAPPLLERALTLPEGLENILLNSLAPDPADRYQSALEVLEDVNDFCYEMGIRLLDVHFATYIDRMMAYRDKLKAARKQKDFSLRDERD